MKKIRHWMLFLASLAVALSIRYNVTTSDHLYYAANALRSPNPFIDVHSSLPKIDPVHPAYKLVLWAVAKLGGEVATSLFSFSIIVILAISLGDLAPLFVASFPASYFLVDSEPLNLGLALLALGRKGDSKLAKVSLMVAPLFHESLAPISLYWLISKRSLLPIIIPIAAIASYALQDVRIVAYGLISTVVLGIMLALLRPEDDLETLSLHLLSFSTPINPFVFLRGVSYSLSLRMSGSRLGLLSVLLTIILLTPISPFRVRTLDAPTDLIEMIPRGSVVYSSFDLRGELAYRGFKVIPDVDPLTLEPKQMRGLAAGADYYLLDCSAVGETNLKLLGREVVGGREWCLWRVSDSPGTGA